jgi:hypothetical protein
VPVDLRIDPTGELDDGVAAYRIVERCDDHIRPTGSGVPETLVEVFTSQPVRSAPNGYGMGVWKSNTDRVPTGDRISSDSVWLGVGVTSTTDVAVCVPPKVAS